MSSWIMMVLYTGWNLGQWFWSRHQTSVEEQRLESRLRHLESEVQMITLVEDPWVVTDALEEVRVDTWESDETKTS